MAEEILHHPGHPHEPEQKPIYDPEGRCLVCSVAVCDEELRRSGEVFAMMQEDLKDLLEALGMFSGARPQSPHEVMREAIEEVKELRERVASS